MCLTAEEQAQIRAYNNERNRKWWEKQTPEERRERRNRYALNAIRKKQNAADHNETA